MLAGADITVHSLCLYAAIGMSATLLAGGISLPCAYLFDPEKSQIVFMMSVTSEDWFQYFYVLCYQTISRFLYTATAIRYEAAERTNN